ncbi:MAG: hypothetical protein JWO78_1141 [Micavibrio sp.]|nr:hypothetical protein [Micavibrio sp.]
MAKQYSLYPATQKTRAPSGTRLRTVTVPKPVYDSYVKLYHSAALLTHAMEQVLNHKDHQSVMDMGIAMGLRMPIERDFREQVRVLKDCLNSFGTDDIDSLTFNAKGEVVSLRLPFNTASGFHATAVQSAHLITMAVNSFYNRDYQACFAQLKEDGAPYKGPVGYKKVSETWHVLLATCVAQDAHAPQGEKLPANWVACAP